MSGARKQEWYEQEWDATRAKIDRLLSSQKTVAANQVVEAYQLFSQYHDRCKKSVEEKTHSDWDSLPSNEYNYSTFYRGSFLSRDAGTETGRKELQELLTRPVHYPEIFEQHFKKLERSKDMSGCDDAQKRFLDEKFQRIKQQRDDHHRHFLLNTEYEKRQQNQAKAREQKIETAVEKILSDAAIAFTELKKNQRGEYAARTQQIIDDLTKCSHGEDERFQPNSSLTDQLDRLAELFYGHDEEAKGARTKETLKEYLEIVKDNQAQLQNVDLDQAAKAQAPATRSRASSMLEQSPDSQMPRPRAGGKLG